MEKKRDFKEQAKNKVQTENKENPENEEHVENKRFEKGLVLSFILVFLFSYTYKLGGYYYTLIPWTFLVLMILTFFYKIKSASNH